MRNLSILKFKIIIFTLIFLKKIKKSIYNYIHFFLIIINKKVVIKKLLGLINLIKAEIFYIYKLVKVDIIYKDKNLIFVIF